MQPVKADELPTNPRVCANPLSSLMFCFTMPLLFKGRRKTLEESDLYRPLKEHKSDILGKKLKNSWDKELHKSQQQNNKTPSLLHAVIRMFAWSFSIMGFVLLFLEVGLKISQPIFLGAYVTYFYDAHADHSSDEQKKAYWYAAGVIGCHCINLLLMHPYTMGILHLTMKVRVSLRSLIYRKSLRLSKASASLVTSDQISQLMTNDIESIDLSFMHYLWIAPLMVIISTYVMYREIGYSALLGIGFMLFFLLLQYYLTGKTSKLNSKTIAYRNERITKITEIITSIEVIKMYAWEIPFGKVIEFLRNKEINVIRQMNYIRGLLLSFVVFVTRFSIFASLLGYVLLGQLLTAESAFVITAYLNILRTTLYINFPMGLTQCKEMLQSLENIEQYLLLEETSVIEKCNGNAEENGKTNKAFIMAESNKSIDTLNLNRGLQNQANAEIPARITIENLKAKWNSKSIQYTLDDVSLSVEQPTLVVITGPTGAGKTSLIQAILKELPAESGLVTVSGTYAYASQIPWIFGSTLRQNILCGMPMDEVRYRSVLEKCALNKDIDSLPNGDRTIIAEDDAELLNDEQKARINFARAMYCEAMIYLLDDPFENMETQRSQQLFEQYICDHKRKNIVILVTQEITFLEKADLIVVMEKGRICATGTYTSMCDTGIDFKKLLHDGQEAALETEKQVITRKDAKLQEQRKSITSKKSFMTDSEEDSVEKKKFEPGWLKALKLYRKYFAYGASYPRIILMLLCFLTAQICASGFDYFLSFWIRKIDHRLHNVNNFNAAVDAFFAPDINIEPRLDENMNPTNIYIFGVFTLTTVFFALARGFLFLNLTTKSSIGLHDDMYNGVTHAGMHFFDTTPTEQIVNRFSKDLTELDELVPLLMMEVLQLAMTTLGFDFVLSIVNPWFMIFTASLGFIFFLLRVFYMSTGDDLISLDLKIRAQINAHVNATINGISTIRAAGAEKDFIFEFDNYQDIHSSAHYMFLASTRAFGYWIDCVCTSYITFITLSFFRFAPASAGSVGLGITQAIGMTNLVQRGIKMSIELEHALPSMTSVAAYGEIESEGELETAAEKQPSKEWPQNGHISFEELSMRYLPDSKTECALKSLNFEILPSEKVGIVETSGANGKSALINALYRLSYNDGAVIIDKHDTNELGLYDLRSKISIIPKDPVLFTGTVRYNLDPFDEYSDAKLWEALEEVNLKTTISELPNGLQSVINDDDSNFKIAQRQLLCMARVILRGNKILLVDEPNDKVDAQTDELLKSVLRNKFKNCTVLTFAKHISSIITSDRVLVLDNGHAVEFGSPYELLTESEDKIFYEMVQKADNSAFDNLLRMAQIEHETRLKTKME